MLSRAMVQTGTRSMEMREFPLPEVGDDDGLLRVEACGLCGTDWGQYIGEYNAAFEFPIIPGHEPVGIIERIGKTASLRWGVKEGDRVAVEPVVACGFCTNCIDGRVHNCTGTSASGLSPYYGFISTELKPSLWGGYAEHLYLPPRAQVHKISSSISPELATMYNPLAAGIHWGIHALGTQVSDTIVILGGGQRGLCSVIAAKETGCSCIIVTGLRRDQYKLDLAREYGADHVIVADEVDVVEAVRKILPKGADVVLDTTPHAPQSVNHAIDMVAPYGKIGLAGSKGSHRVNGLDADMILAKSAQLHGIKGAPRRANVAAIQMIESGRFPLEKMHTHSVPLDQAEYALKLLGGEIEGEQPIHITINP